MRKCIAAALAVTVLLTMFIFTGSAVALFKGDLDRDGMVIAGEARLILRISAKLDPAPEQDSEDFLLADVNGDGQLLADDARKALRISAKLEDNIPLEEASSITVSLATDPGSLDPAFSDTTASSSLLCHLFSGLACWSVDGEGRPVVVPDAAEELPEGVLNADGTVTYTYKLREGLKWSDGKPVTAGDFVFAWNRAADPVNETPYAYMFEIVDGYGGNLHISAPDDRTFVVTAASDAPYWNELLCMPAAFPVRGDVVSDDPDWAYKADTFVCNGRYTLAEWNHDASITIVRNAAHPDAANVTMDRITFLLTEDADALRDAFAEGEVSFVSEVGPDAHMEFPGAFRSAPKLGTYFAVWNVEKNLLPEGSALTGAEAEKANAEIRRAISLLIDRNHITEDITRQGQKPASSFVASGMLDADGTEFYLNAGSSENYAGYYDVSPEALAGNREKAAETLKKYYDFDENTGKFTNVPPLEYVFNDSPGHAEIGEGIRDSLAEAGIELTLRSMSWADLRDPEKRGDYALARDGWIADYTDPISFLDLWTGAGSFNLAQLGAGSHRDVRAYSLDLTPYGIDLKVEDGTWEETFGGLISVIERTKDRDTRFKLMHLAEDMLMETGCICPIYYYTDAFLIDPHLKGFYTNPLGYKYFAYTTYEKAE